MVTLYPIYSVSMQLKNLSTIKGLRNIVENRSSSMTTSARLDRRFRFSDKNAIEKTEFDRNRLHRAKHVDVNDRRLRNTFAKHRPAIVSGHWPWPQRTGLCLSEMHSSTDVDPCVLRKEIGHVTFKLELSGPSKAVDPSAALNADSGGAIPPRVRQTSVSAGGGRDPGGEDGDGGDNGENAEGIEGGENELFAAEGMPAAGECVTAGCIS